MMFETEEWCEMWRQRKAEDEMKKLRRLKEKKSG
jgi:hypothetical protein